MTQSIRDTILAMRAPDLTPEFIQLHEAIELCHKLGNLTDEFLNRCTVGECIVCGEIICPYHEPLHFHHDGCPACSTGKFYDGQ